jgi:hypothetical protein
MAAKKKQTKAQARRKAMLKIKQEGLRKKGKIYGDAIKKIKWQETAAKVISGAGLLVPGSAPLVGAAKLGKVVRAAKAAKKAVKKKALKRLPGESTRKRSVEQLRQPYRK